MGIIQTTDFEALSTAALMEATGQVRPVPIHVRESEPIDFSLWLLSPESRRAIEALMVRLSQTDTARGANRQKLARHLRLVLANLIQTQSRNEEGYVAYPRSANRYIRRYTAPNVGYRPMMRVVNGLLELGLIENRRGSYSAIRGSGYIARMRATDELRAFLFNEHSITPPMVTRLEYPKETIILRDRDGRDSDYCDDEGTNAMRELVARYNDSLATAQITLSRVAGNDAPDFSQNQVHRVFNHGSFGLGGRFYGPWWQSYRRLRPHILINRQPTIEHDFGAQFVHLLYSEEGRNYHQIYGANDDPYMLPGYDPTVRGALKASLIRILNCGSRTEAIRNIGAMMREEYPELRDQVADTIALINAFEAKHLAIRHHFYTDPSLRLQNIDAKITERIIDLCLGAGIIVLTIHDSYIVERRNAEYIIQVMRQACADIGLTSTPPIRRV